jgi:hypothetical protein
MKTNRILIAFSFPFVFAACGTENNDSNLSPITRWALAVNARVHPPAFYEPDPQYARVAAHCEAIVKQDMKIAWRFANRPDLIEDSTVMQLTGEYVKSDSLPQVFEHHMAALDAAENVQENYTIDYSRQFASDPDYWKNKPLVLHTAGEHSAEMEALRTALLLRTQVLAMEAAADKKAEGEGIPFGAIISH